MRRLLVLAFSGHAIGTLLTILAPRYSVLLGASFLIGLANGLTEAVINPLIATLYPERKTHKLNVLHAWWPGGLILAGLAGYGVTKALGLDAADVSIGAAALGWKIKMALILLPTAIYGVLLLGTTFPPTERVASGIPAREMLRECVRPMFLVWFFCMWLTAATELGPAQWVPSVLTRTARTPGILVFVYVNVLLFVMRSFAGKLVHGRFPDRRPLVLLAPLFRGPDRAELCDERGVRGLRGGGDRVGHRASASSGRPCWGGPPSSSRRRRRLLLGMMGTAGNLAIFFVMPVMGGNLGPLHAAGAARGREPAQPWSSAAASDPAVAERLETARAAGSRDAVPLGGDPPGRAARRFRPDLAAGPGPRRIPGRPSGVPRRTIHAEVGSLS
jgi:MFS family permease